MGGILMGFKGLKKWWKSLGRWERIFILCAVGVFTKYGGSKHISGKVSVMDDYIADGGSYITNNVVHVALKKKSNLLPDATEILVYARELSSTNSADWFRLLPFLTFGDHPHDYELENATNYNVIVAANYASPPSVHTNGVLIIKGFLIPGTSKMAFPNSKVKEFK